MNKRSITTLVAVASLTASAIGLTSGVSGAATQHATILTEETNVGVNFVNNFNPAAAESISSLMSTNSLSYEPLIQYDSLKPGVWYPWLATNEVFNSTGQSVTFTMNPKAEWSNGVKLTAQDVANQFNQMSDNASLDVFGLPTLAQPARAVGDTVTLTYATPQFSNEETLGSILIFPVTGDKGLPASSLVTSGSLVIPNNDIVGDGPYLPTSYSSQLLSYTLSPHWAITKKPYVTGVNVPYYAVNGSAEEALDAHLLDWAGNDIPQVQKVYVSHNPKENHYFSPGGSTVTLWFNVSPSAPDGQTDCLQDANFRYAISMAINRNKLAAIGETGLEQPATSTSGMTPLQSKYEGSYKNNIQLNGWTTAKVTSYLESKGYTLNSNHYFQVTSKAAQAATKLKAGTVCQFSIQDPSSYTDYFEDEQLVSSMLNADHIKVSTIGVSTGQWLANIYTHDFDAIIHWGAGGSNPYGQFQNWLADPATTGGSTNYGEYSNAAVQKDLIALAAASPGTPTFQSTVNKISAIMTSQVPMAPLLYGADWDVYSTARFTGWVTPANQYAYPGPGGNSLPYILMRLTKS